MNLWRLASAVADACGARDALRWRGSAWSYAHLAGRATRFANVLAAHGVGLHHERDRLADWESGQDLVGTYLLNGPEYVEVTLGGYAARAAPFNVNYRYVNAELAYLLRDAGAGALVYHARFAPNVREVLPALDRRPLLLQVADESGEPLVPGALDYEAALAAAPAVLEIEGHRADDLYVLYTGGTTGMPKGTLWRQADIWTAALSSGRTATLDIAAIAASAASNPRPARLLPNAPLMHGAAHWAVLATLLSGGTVVLNDVVDRLDPADVWRLVDGEDVHRMLMVGEAFARPLMDEFDRGGRRGDSLRTVLTGGAAMTPATKQRILDALPRIRIIDTAGASETGSALSAVSGADGVGAAAVFAPGAGATVLDAELRHELAPGAPESGWFAKRGAIPLGYLGDAAKTQRTFPVVHGVRWSVPGDRARRREDGLVELLGRDSVTINTGGEKVFAEEVEAALMAHPAVRDVVAVGRPSERWGQEVVAVISLTAGHEPVADDELIAVAAAHLARYKLPKAVVRVDAVRRGPNGKADYRWAREVATGASGDA